VGNEVPFLAFSGAKKKPENSWFFYPSSFSINFLFMFDTVVFDMLLRVFYRIKSIVGYKEIISSFFKRRRKMRYLGFIFIMSVLYFGLVSEGKAQPSQEEKKPEKIELAIRMDDLGYCHGVNMALKKILEQGVCTSVSVIVNTPWVDEAAEILRDHPEVSVGIHLVLNSEWKEFRWGPVVPYTEVPSLVDGFGRFYGSRRELMAHEPKVAEVEKELRAQIEKGLRKGLKISYCDYHMGAALNCLEFQEVVEKLALEYHIGISRYFGEEDTEKVYSTPPEEKTKEGIKIVEALEPGRHVFVVHPGMDIPEMSAMTDLNVFGLKKMSVHRQAVTDMLCDPGFKQAIQKKGIELINYNHLRDQGLHLMERPFTAKPWKEIVQKAQMGDSLAGTVGGKY